MPRRLPQEQREAVRALLGSDLSDYEISRRTGVGRSTVCQWRHHGIPVPPAPDPVKLDREIELVPWQQEIVEEHPKAFLRGPIHSDGSRCMNTFTVELKTGPKQYSYPRYFFTNYSADIQAIFCDVCDRLGIRWSRSNWRNISISHYRSVALLDEFIGPRSWGSGSTAAG